MLKTCSYPCAIKYLDSEKGIAKKNKILNDHKAKGFREKKEKVKGVKYWLDYTKKVAQEYAALRDRNKPCISCDKEFSQFCSSYLKRWDGGHYKTSGAHSELQLHLWNIHGQCRDCNGFKSGNIANQQINIVKRYGQERLDFLDSYHEKKQYDIEYLKRYRKVLRKRMKRFKQ